MDLQQVLQSRRSVRRFQDRDVPQQALDTILRLACSAPSAGNIQPYEIVVVRSPETLERLARAALGQSFVARAPLVLVFLEDPERSARTYGQRGAELYVTQDTSIACAYAQLAATALGLASCWVGAFYPEQVRAALQAPPKLTPTALLTVGYPDETPAATGRRPLSQVVHLESYGGGAGGEK